MKCHRQHFWLHGLNGRDIDDSAIQHPSPERTTRARLRELAQLACDARQVARPYRAFEALHDNG
ncbi:hypothetical protein DEIPH_ctg139orf0093 [Deinococcus phoenicis]|uniref:Uncharacterized protein n=1 Tax=Deinococcus phoenicis TaxID=1476583 RepID=A0A016QJW9_9DEIO|nr:hypothetical protein [Deinococcus phoenicis]EYB66368.1 hypothetical protein DEIPH_ctg139orf0093 [Deinococcus phoenicis]